MSTNTRMIHASPHDVFAVFGQGWLFTSWVVGAARVRDVDASWPAVGAGIHHSFGVWPLVINDATTILDWVPDAHVRFRARGWPIGEAEVVIDVQGRADGCVVRMREYPVAGPGRLIPSVVLDAGLHIRNREALQRLAWLAEGNRRSASGNVD
jgi:Polyketide cyclase / dehydrase and lipid transport